MFFLQSVVGVLHIYLNRIQSGPFPWDQCKQLVSHPTLPYSRIINHHVTRTDSEAALAPVLTPFGCCCVFLLTVSPTVSFAVFLFLPLSPASCLVLQSGRSVALPVCYLSAGLALSLSVQLWGQFKTTHRAIVAQGMTQAPRCMHFIQNTAFYTGQKNFEDIWLLSILGNCTAAISSMVKWRKFRPLGNENPEYMRGIKR